MGEIDRGDRLLGVAGDFCGDGCALGAPPRDRGAAQCRLLHLATEPSAPAPTAHWRVVLPPSCAPGLTRRFQGRGDFVMNKPSRRAVVRTGVWAVPVVATAAAAPAFAGTDTPPPVVILGTGSGCKVSGGSGQGDPKEYNMVITFDNTSQTNQDVTIT